MSQESPKKLRDVCWKTSGPLSVVEISINYKLCSFNIAQTGFRESLSFMLPGFFSQIMGEVSYPYFNIQGWSFPFEYLYSKKFTNFYIMLNNKLYFAISREIQFSCNLFLLLYLSQKRLSLFIKSKDHPQH